MFVACEPATYKARSSIVAVLKMGGIVDSVPSGSSTTARDPRLRLLRDYHGHIRML